MRRLAGRLCAVLLAGLVSCSSGSSSSGPGAVTQLPTTAPVTVPSGRLVGTVSYNAGLIRFDPPPMDLNPATTAEGAYSAFSHSGLYQDAPSFSAPSVQFALFSDYKTSRNSGRITTNRNGVPVWVVTFTGVPVLSGESAPPSGPPTSDVVDIVDATAGTSLLLIRGIPDTTPQLTPAPPTP